MANHNYQERLLLSPAQMIVDNTSLLISNKDTISNQVCAPVKQSVLVSRQLNVNLESTSGNFKILNVPRINLWTRQKIIIYSHF